MKMLSFVLTIQFVCLSVIAQTDIDFERARMKSEQASHSHYNAWVKTSQGNLLNAIIEKFSAEETIVSKIKCSGLDVVDNHITRCDFKTASGRLCRARLDGFESYYHSCALQGGIWRATSYGDYLGVVVCYPEVDDKSVTTIKLTKSEYENLTGQKAPETKYSGNCIF